MKQWEKYAGEVSRVKGQKVTLPSYDKVLISTELVLDDQSQLREGNRVYGENEVREGEGVRWGEEGKVQWSKGGVFESHRDCHWVHGQIR